MSTSKVYKITQSALTLQESYWWTKPGLGLTSGEEGAHIIDGGARTTLWEDRDYINKLRSEEQD